MKLISNKDKLIIEYGDRIISDVKVSFQYYGKTANYVDIFNGDWTVVNEYTATAPAENGGKITLFVNESEFGLLLNAIYKTGKSQTIESALRLRIQGRLPLRPKTAIYNDSPFWFCGNRCNFSMVTESYTSALVLNQKVSGAEYVAFRGEDKKEFGVVGAVTFEHYFTTVTIAENGRFEAISHLNEHLYVFDTITVEPNTEVFTDEFLIALSDEDVMPIRGKAIAKFNGVEKKFSDISGYSTGYYYGPVINEENQLAAIACIKKNNLPIKYFQLDWGWFKSYGEWDAKPEAFPHGMKWMADKIYEAGMIPGIWIAPLLNDENCMPRKEHPEWFVFGHDYKSGKQVYWDFSVEGAAKWLYDVFHKISYEWGYRYIKIDFLIEALGLGGYSKKGFNAMDNIRTMWEIIKSAVTEDTYLLSCTQQLGPCAGYSDGMRIGMDIFEGWAGLKDCARMTLKRLFINEYGVLDPDCLLLRKSEQEDEECTRFCTRNDREIDTFITYQSLTGGAIIYSDKLQLFSDREFDRMKALLPVNNIPAKAMDLYDNEIPSIFTYGERNGYEMWALINWQDHDETFTISLKKEMFAKEFFTKLNFDKAKEHSFTLEPHQSMILYFSKDKSSLDKLGNSIIP